MALPSGGNLACRRSWVVGQPGAPPTNPMIQPMMQQGMAIIQDASQVKQQTELLDKIAKTLELLYAYQVGAAAPPVQAIDEDDGAARADGRRRLRQARVRAGDAEAAGRGRQAQRHQRALGHARAPGGRYRRRRRSTPIPRKPSSSGCWCRICRARSSSSPTRA